MTHTVCIYLDKNVATSAATLARRKGATAHVKVKSTDVDEKSLFLIETEKSQQQKIIDTIAEAARENPALRREALTCPQCDSIRIQFPLQPEVSPTMRALDHLLNGIANLFGIKRPSKFRCRKCGNEWT